MPHLILYPRGTAVFFFAVPYCAVVVALLYKAREEELCQLGLRTLRSNPRVAILGDTGRKRLPIFSFLIRHGTR